MYVCWSLKGGSGTTVVAAALSLVKARSAPTLLVDLCGDQPAALGIAEPGGPGLRDWLSSPSADPEALLELAVPVGHHLRLLPDGSGWGESAERWQQAAEAFAGAPCTVVVDAGVGTPHPALLAVGCRSLLVTRSCYLALRRSPAMAHVPDGVVLVEEPGRAVGATQVGSHLRCPILATVPFDPAVYRSVDAGLLAARLPPSIAKPLERIQ